VKVVSSPTVERTGSAVGGHNLVRDEQAQAQGLPPPAVGHRPGTAKQGGELLRGHALAGVLHHQLRPCRAQPPEAHVDLRALGRVGDRVVEQVEHDLLEIARGA
jgi:hypothetical protein